MNEYYLVQVHDDTGRLYISNINPKKQFDNNLEVLFTWDENKTPLLSTVSFLIKGQLLSKEDIENELELQGITEKDYTTVVRKLINSIQFDIMIKRIYVRQLHDARMISSQTKTSLLISLSRMSQGQVKYVRSFPFNEIDFNKVKENQYRARTIYLSKPDNK